MKNFQSKFKKGVSLNHQFDDYISYNIECDCGSKDCGLTMTIECDTKWGIIELHFYNNARFDYWRYSDPGIVNYFKRQWKENNFKNNRHKRFAWLCKNDLCI